MVRAEASSWRATTAVWKECVKPKDAIVPQDKAPPAATAKAAPAPPPSAASPAPAPPPAATPAAAPASGNSRRKAATSTTTAGNNAAVAAPGAAAAVGAAAPGGGAIAACSSTGSANTVGATSTTANGWLEAPPPFSTVASGFAATAPPFAAAGRPLAPPAASATGALVAMPTAVGTMQPGQESAHSGEVFLMEMLAAMDQHMQQLRETQQGLVATVELACRRALGRSFVRLVLVGSVALRVETPGSDVDVVCFTRKDGPEGIDGHHDAVGLPVDVLRRVHWALTALVSQYADNGANFSMELIDDARVPILRVLWGRSIAVDVSVDQSRPVDHVRWFQRVGAAPRPTAPPPAVAPLVTLTLRCVKWWIRQRQIPRTKEGGLPTLAWLLMAVHVCSLPETHEQAIISGQRPMVALLASLAAFFHHYAATDGLDGTLMFAADGSSSEFKRRSGEKKPSPRHATSQWAELSVLDPTREGVESLDLAPRLHPATQLLLAHELRRASQRLHRVPKGREIQQGDGRKVLEEVFEPLPEGMNALPSFAVCNMQTMGALLLYDSDYKGVGTVELAIIDRIVPRPGWAAPFLHRSDDRSELFVRLLDVEDRTGKAAPRRKGNNEVVLCPCHFICRVHLEKDGKSWRLDSEGFERLKAMKRYMSDLGNRHRTNETTASKKVETLALKSETPLKTGEEPVVQQVQTPVQKAPIEISHDTLPTPSRGRTP